MADLLLDPTVVEAQVLRLNRKADALGFVGVVLGVIPGAAIGGFPIVANGPIPPKYGIASLLLGALLGGALGHILASSRGFTHRLRAQMMLGQLRLEQNVAALLAVSEHPAPIRALPAPEPVHALPEAPRIEEIIGAGLGLPEPTPATEVAATLESTPPVQHEALAPAEPSEPEPVAPTVHAEPEPAAELQPAAAPAPTHEPEPEILHELVPPAPAWAAALDQALPSLGIEPARAPEPASDPAAPSTWGLPAREEPAPAPAPPATPTPPAWPRAAETEPEPMPAPTPLPLPEPLRPDFGSTTPAWAPPAPAPAVEEAAAEEPVPPAPAAHTDLSSLSIAEIARLADAGSL
jgi:hypothetical protein